MRCCHILLLLSHAHLLSESFVLTRVLSHVVVVFAVDCLSVSFCNFLSQAAKDYALEHMKQVTVRGHPIRCFVSDSKTQLLVINLPPQWTAGQLKVELERIGGPMLGEPQITRPGSAICSYINYRRAEKALSLISGKPCGTQPIPGAPLMNASLAVGKPPPKIPQGSGKPPATLFIKNIASSINEEMLARYFLKHVPVVTKTTIVRDPVSGESKGFGFVEVRFRERKRRGTALRLLARCG